MILVTLPLLWMAMVDGALKKKKQKLWTSRWSKNSSKNCRSFYLIQNTSYFFLCVFN